MFGRSTAAAIRKSFEAKYFFDPLSMFLGSRAAAPLVRDRRSHFCPPARRHPGRGAANEICITEPGVRVSRAWMARADSGKAAGERSA